MAEYRLSLAVPQIAYTCVAQEIRYLWLHKAQITSLTSLT